MGGGRGVGGEGGCLNHGNPLTPDASPPAVKFSLATLHSRRGERGDGAAVGLTGPLEPRYPPHPQPLSPRRQVLARHSPLEAGRRGDDRKLIVTSISWFAMPPAVCPKSASEP